MSNQRRTSVFGPYVGGSWVETDDELEVSNLAEDGPMEPVAAAGVETVDRALTAAADAEDALAETTIPERVEWLEAIAAGIREREGEIAETVVREAGKPIARARSEVGAAADRFEHAVAEIRTLRGEYREGTAAGHGGWDAIVRPEPVGTVACVVPFNYPVATAALQIAPALAAGNAVVVKPPSTCPKSVALLTEVVSDIGLPDGAVNYLPGRSSVIGDPLASDDRVDAIALTGSSRAGERVADQSGMTVLHMELGGNAPAIVREDADLEQAASCVTTGGLKGSGQRCSAVSRVLVDESVHDDLLARVDEQFDDWQSGDLFDPETDLGPLISEDAATNVIDLVEDAVDRGATLVRGGERDGQFVEPTLLADVPTDARIVFEEQFGPVVPLVPVAGDEAAIELTNGDDYGLDAAVFTNEHDAAMEIADAVDVGAVRINGAPSHGIGDIPYGGVRDSGIGREGIGETIEAFTETKTIVL